MTACYPSSIREEELKNKVAADFFGAFDCTRIIGNVDFCVAAKTGGSRSRATEPAADALEHVPSLYWAEAKNHPTDIHQMLAQLILTIGRAACPHAAAAAVAGRPPYHADEPPRFIGCFDNEKIAFVEYHHILPVFNLNDFNWTQTPSGVDEKTVETVRRVVPADKIVVFRFGADDAEIKAFVRRNFTSGEGPALATPIDRNNFTFIYQKWRAEVMPHIDAPWDVLKKKYALYDRDFFLAEMNVDDNGTPEVTDDHVANDFYITFDVNSPTPYTVKRKNEDELNFNLTFGFKAAAETAAPHMESRHLGGGLSAYASFWRRYKRPPKREYWDFIVSRLDLLVPQDVRERKGSFFTPTIWVEKSQQCIADVLGENWQDEYYVWDCAGGTGNLEVGLTNKYRVWVSTLDQQDVDVIHERIRNGANLLESHVFRFDFLNDPFDKLPQGLKEIIADPEKRRRLVIYINPPYAEAGDIRQRSGTGQNKTDVSVVHATYNRYLAKIGIAGRELFAQFFMRIHDEIPGCVLAEFSKLKHLQSPNFKAFRQAFRGTIEKCFIVPADTFDNVKGDFPIGFFVWRLGAEEMPAAPKHGGNGDAKTRRSFESFACAPSDGASSESCESGGDGLREATHQKQTTCLRASFKSPCLSAAGNNGVFASTVADVYDRKGEFIGTKTILAYDDVANIGKWVNSFRHDNDLHLGFMSNGRNDFQNTNLVYFINDRNQLSTPRGWWITPPNLIPMCIFVAVRHSVKATWLNDRDTFLYPNGGWQNDFGFQSDCVVYTLFSDFNVIKSKYGVNHWIPFTEEEVGAKDCFASHFMSDWLAGKRRVEDAAPCQGDLFAVARDTRPCQNSKLQDSKTPSSESNAARAVLDAGRALWRYYHAQPGANPNASYYDIRLHFQGVKRTASGKEQMNATSSDETYNKLLAALRSAHKALAAQIAPKVYEYGFLKK